MDEDDLPEALKTPHEELEHYDEPTFEWIKPPGSGLKQCVICRKPTKSHQLEVETAPMTGFALRICHSCYDEYGGDGAVILDAYHRYREERSA